MKITLKIQKIIQWVAGYGDWVYKFYAFLLAITLEINSWQDLYDKTFTACTFAILALLLYIIAFENNRIKDWQQGCKKEHIEQQINMLKFFVIPFAYLLVNVIMLLFNQTLGEGFLTLFFKIWGVNFICDKIAKAVTNKAYPWYCKQFYNQTIKPLIQNGQWLHKEDK